MPFDMCFSDSDMLEININFSYEAMHLIGQRQCLCTVARDTERLINNGEMTSCCN